MASSEPSTSRLPEEDSSDMDSDSDNEVSQIDIDSQISTSIRSSKSAKKQSCVYHRQCAKTFPWATTSRKGSSFAFCMKCSHGINLERVVLEISETSGNEITQHSEKDGVGLLPLQSYFGPIREESVTVQKYSSHISLESTILPFNWEIIVPNYSSWCFLILLLLKTLSAVI